MPKKPLFIALQMDALETIQSETDTTFLLACGAQERGHRLFHYTPQNLSWVRGRLLAHGAMVQVNRAGAKPYTCAAPETVALDDVADVILLRQNPPFDMGYITSTYLLELAAQKRPVKIINDPVGVRNAPEKLLITHFADFIPPTLVSSQAEAIAAFAAAQGGTLVGKKLYGCGGRDVFRFDTAKDAVAAAATHLAQSGEPMMFQAFLPNVQQEGDKRIILFDGQVAGALRRIPQNGEFRANLALGARAEPCTLTADEQRLCTALAPLLQAMGLFFVGLDVIGSKLIEINVTSPSGLLDINLVYSLKDEERMEMRFWQSIERSLGADA